MAKYKQATVDTPSCAYHRMAEAWDPIDDLMGGTRAMRLAGERWLPKEKGESKTAYRARLTRSVLFGALRDTVGGAVSKPFAKPVTIKGKAPEYTDKIEKDANREGLDLTGFVRAVFQDTVTHGISYILVDFPRVNAGLNYAVEKNLDVRPYFVHVRARDLIFAKVEERPDGSDAVTEIRMREYYTAHDGFGDSVRRRVRVITAPTYGPQGEIVAPGRWEIHEQDEKGVFAAKAAGTHTYPGIPIVPVYTGRVDLFEAIAPFEDLAWLNIAHWQSTSDHRNIIHVARVPILFGAGFADEEKESPFEIGSSRIVLSGNHEAKLVYVEHTGAAIKVGAEDIKDLEERMEVLGLQPYMRRAGGQTATGQMIDESRTQSDMKSWVVDLAGAVREAYRIAATWVKQTLPEDFKIEIYGDFELGMKASADIEQLLKARATREISRETFLAEIKRRALISDSIKIEEEIARIEEEGQALGLMGGDPNADPNADPTKTKNAA